jgi:SOS-response transcriptional repressor LexA
MTLSPRESQVLSYIALCIELLGHAPTQREISRRLGANSREFVGRILKNLEAKGMIRRQMYKVRGIEVIKQELRAA